MATRSHGHGLDGQDHGDHGLYGQDHGDQAHWNGEGPKLRKIKTKVYLIGLLV